MKCLLVLVFISELFICFGDVLNNNIPMRCQRAKAFAYCGAKTMVATQWFFNVKQSQCLPFKYCINLLEETIDDNSMENRFENEVQCQSICQKKTFSTSSDSLKEKLRKLRLKGLKKTLSIHYQQQNPNTIQSFSHIEVDDPLRCTLHKPYSYCGSRTTPRIHWVYNKRLNRCLPYTFCESVVNLLMTTENDFISEKECIDLCIK